MDHKDNPGEEEQRTAERTTIVAYSRDTAAQRRPERDTNLDGFPEKQHKTRWR